MRKLYLLAYLSFSNLLWVEETYPYEFIKGEMNCEVTETEVIKIGKGKLEHFSGYKGEYDVGDRLDLTYEMAHYKESDYGNISISIRDPERGEIINNNFKADSVYNSFYEKDCHQLNSYFNCKNGNLAFNSDKILDHNHYGSTFSLKRYYMSDWSGFLIETGILGAEYFQYTGLDCRHSIDKVADIYTYVKENWNKDK